MTRALALLQQDIEAFAKLHAREIRHPEELSLSPELTKAFTRLCPFNARPGNLEMRIARGLRLETLEALDFLAKANKPVTMLDCGSGWGTQAIFFAFLGAKVIGVELIQERVDIAEARLEWFRKQTDRPLDVTFVAGNVFPVLRERPCELVWICQAISHIHPAEDFLSELYETMPPDGVVIISDANWMNPRARWFLYKQFWRMHRNLRWYSHSRYKDPQTGKPVEMAEERVFSPAGLAELMRRSGFKVTKVISRGFLPVFRLSADGKLTWAFKLFDKLDSMISALPVLGRTGTFLVATGCKEDNP